MMNKTYELWIDDMNGSPISIVGHIEDVRAKALPLAAKGRTIHHLNVVSEDGKRKYVYGKDWPRRLSSLVLVSFEASNRGRS